MVVSFLSYNFPKNLTVLPFQNYIIALTFLPGKKKPGQKARFF